MFACNSQWLSVSSDMVIALQAVVPYLSASVSKDKAEKVALDVLSHFFKEMQEKTRVVEEEEDGEDLCDCEFSLAYGLCPLPALPFLLPVAICSMSCILVCSQQKQLAAMNMCWHNSVWSCLFT